MLIYIDNEYKCHIENNDNFTSIEVPFFDNKCQTFIEGYRYIPEGQQWTNEKGEVFIGEMISPCQKLSILKKAQLEYENEQLKIQNAAYESALSEIEEALGITK